MNFRFCNSESDSFAEWENLESQKIYMTCLNIYGPLLFKLLLRRISNVEMVVIILHITVVLPVGGVVRRHWHNICMN